MNLTIVLLLEGMYIYIKKEYYTEAADFIVSLVKNRNEEDQTKFDRVEKEILHERKKRTQSKLSQSMILDRQRNSYSFCIILTSI